MNSNNRTAATLYSLGDTVCLRNITINTLHTGDHDDDDDDDNNNDNNGGHSPTQDFALNYQLKKKEGNLTWQHICCS